MIEITQVQITQQQIAQNYAAALDSCNLINRINAQTAQSSDDVESIAANKEHLLIMLGKPYWTTEDLEPLRLSASYVKQPYVAPILSMAEAKATKLTQLTQAYSTAIQQPVSYMSTTFQADAVSVANVQATLAGLSKAGATPTGFYWVSADNTQVPFSYADIQGLAAAMLSQGWSAFAHLQAQKAIVNASSTVSAVQGVVW